MPDHVKPINHNPIIPLTHAYSHITCFIITIQPNGWQTPKTKKETEPKHSLA